MISKWKNFRSERLDLKRSSLFEGGSLENLGESLFAAVAGACTSRKVQAMEEGGVPPSKGATAREG